jgi:EmrB/QacA subfamily drug resistance transporter
MTVVSVACALFMQSIDSTALSTALPTLARAFSTDPIHLKLALTAYIMALAVFVPASAWAADRYGPRRVFITAISIFLLGSVLCALSHSLTQLVAARILQGAGGAMMVPVGRIIVVALHPRDQLIAAMSWLTTPAVLGPILGPPLSGFILSVADWPWIFYINVPVGLLGIAAVLRFVPKIKQPHPGKFDSVGFVLIAVVISAAMMGAESAGVGLMPWPAQLVVWLTAAAGGVGYMLHARGRARPVLKLSLLKIATYRANCTGGSLMRMTLGAMPFLLPLLLQGGLGWTPLQAGITTTSSALGTLGARVGAQFALRKFGFRVMLIATALASGVTLASIGWFRASTPIVAMVLVLGLNGFLRSNHLTSTSSLAFADIPDADVSQASSLTAVVQQLSQALGITLAGLMLHIAQGMGARHGLRSLAPENFVLPYGVIGLGAALSILAYLRLPANAGASLHGRRRR